MSELSDDVGGMNLVDPDSLPVFDWRWISKALSHYLHLTDTIPNHDELNALGGMQEMDPQTAVAELLKDVI
jgi:hypothetical protein